MEELKEQAVKKKQYQEPKLLRYGDLLEVTRSIIGGTGKSDALKASDKTA